MSRSRLPYRVRRRLSTTAKVAALIAALGFVTVMLEQPRLTASPSRPRATIEQSLLPTAAREAAMTRRAPETTAPAYFPGQFALPGGEVDPQPIGF